MMTKTEKKLYEKLCSSIKTLITKGALYAWDMGYAIEQLYVSKLWRKTYDDTRGDAYTSFERFLRREFGLKEKTVVRYRRIARSFERTQVKGWREEHLHMLANVKNPLRRQKLYNTAVTHSFPVVEKEIRKLPATELHFSVQKDKTYPSIKEPWSLTDIQHMLDEYENSHIRVDIIRGKYRVSLVQGSGKSILGVASSTRLTGAVGILKTKLERQRQRSSRSA